MSKKQEDVEELLVKLATCKTKREYEELLDKIIKATNLPSKTVQLDGK